MNDQSVGSDYYQIKFWGKKILILSIFSLFQNYVLQKILVFVLLEHQLNSNLSCEGGEERLIEERRGEMKLITTVILGNSGRRSHLVTGGICFT